MPNEISTDIAVIGGGASGFSAALSAKRTCDCDVVIAERLDKTGRKLLATGNGRCNLSNRNLTSEHYHGSVKNLMEIIENGTSAEDFFAGIGILCVSDSEGRMYPRSGSAATVLSSLRMTASSLGVREECGFRADRIDGSFGKFRIISDSGIINCKRVIAAAGGYAAPSFGTDGSAVRMLRDMGCRTAKICPAAAPLRVRPESVKGLKGVRAKCMVSAVSGGDVLKSEYGEVQFTENSLSGICIFNLSYLLSEHEGDLSIHIDTAPDMTQEQLEEYLCTVQALRFDQPLEELLTGIYTKNLAVYITKKALGRPLNEAVSTLSFKELRCVARTAKCLEFDISGSSPWQNAQVTSGGIHGSCLTDDLELRQHHGIWLCGEIVDADGCCGGYNLQWAWSSGELAGRMAALSLGTEAST